MKETFGILSGILMLLAGVVFFFSGESKETLPTPFTQEQLVEMNKQVIDSFPVQQVIDSLKGNTYTSLHDVQSVLKIVENRVLTNMRLQQTYETTVSPADYRFAGYIAAASVFFGILCIFGMVLEGPITKSVGDFYAAKAEREKALTKHDKEILARWKQVSERMQNQS